MKRIPNTILALAVVFGLILAAQPASAQEMKQALQEKAVALKQSIAENQKSLRQYGWIEKMELSLKGEVKSTKIEQCRYGPDGKVQKTVLAAPPEKEKKRGLKGKIVEKKTNEMEEYMDRVVSLVRRYVPPSPEMIKTELAEGKASLSQAGPGAIQLQFRDSVKSGDAVTFTVDSAAKAIRQLKVDTYMDEEMEKVTLTVDFQTLPDGTNYAAVKTLDVTAKKIVVKITDSNYQKLAS